MTLIVGVLCKDGVAVAADGAATLGSLGQSTARQPVKKLVAIEGRVVVGVSGPVGLFQLLSDRIEKLATSSKLSGTHCKTPADAMRVLSEEMKKDILPALQSAQVAAKILGPQVASRSAVCSAVVALPVGRKPALLQFDHQCTPEAATEDLPFVSVGSGQTTADPFLAFVRHVFWPDQLPNLADGIFAATWTLRHAIRTSPGGLADPIQVMVLEGDSVRELDAAELGEHEQNVSAAEEHMKGFREQFVGSLPGTEEPPDISES